MITKRKIKKAFNDERLDSDSKAVLLVITAKTSGVFTEDKFIALFSDEPDRIKASLGKLTKAQYIRKDGETYRI